MDSKDQLAKDMVEQLLKFMPSAEEKTLLEDHADEIESMARADRFLYDLTKISHYEQRIRTLFYKKKFKERIGDCKPKIEAVLEACKEVQRSKRLRRFLEIVLAFGNYMNRGQRGNASGFHISSLNRIADTKSSLNRNITLLHYILSIAEKKFKDVLALDEDIPRVRQAAKVNLSELSKEMLSLKVGLQEVQKELDYNRSRSCEIPGDQYVAVMKEFITIATYQLSELEDNFQDMKLRYEKVLRIFGEDATHIQADDFFTIFDNFLTTFVEARQENELMKRRKEDEERARQEEEQRKLERLPKDESSKDANRGERMSGIHTMKGDRSSKGEFDDLIAALRTGDVFGEDFTKHRRNRKRISAQNSPVHNTDINQWKSRTLDSNRDRERSYMGNPKENG